MSEFQEYATRLLETGYEPIPIRAGEKLPAAKGWRRGEITQARVDRWARQFPDAAVGIRLGHPVPGDPTLWVMALDADTLSEAVAAELRVWLHDLHPGAPVRVGLPPKFLLPFLYRSPSAPTKRMSPRYEDFLGRFHRVEVLGHGQQAVVAGIHPDTGRPYRWEGASALDLEAGALPILDDDDLDGVVALFTRLMEEQGAEVADDGAKARPQDPEIAAAEAEGDEGLLALLRHRDPLEDYSVERCRADLRLVPCQGEHDSYHGWVRMGMGIHHQFRGAPEGLELWDEWSQGGADYPGPEALEEKWATFGEAAYRGVPVTIRSLIWQANRARDEAAKAALAEPEAERLPADELREELARDDEGRIIRGLANVILVLARDDQVPPIWKNELSGDIMYGGREFRDEDLAMLRYRLAVDYLFESPADKVQTGVQVLAVQRARHPVRDYLNGLVWDGQPRLGRWLTDYLGAADAGWVREVGAKTLVAAVARAFAPGTKWDSLLILEGPQGGGKSTAVHALSPRPEWTADLEFSQNEQRMVEVLRGVWLVEAGELRGLARGDSDLIKALLSREKDTYRPAYGRNVVHQPRQCILIGTTNHGNYLKDDTGNRRFIPVQVGPIDVAALAADRDQLWAEATHAYREGMDLRWTEATRQALAGEQDGRLIRDEWEESVREYLEKDPEAKLRGKTIVFDCFGITEDKFDRTMQQRLASIMTRLGWKSGTPWVEGKKVRAYMRAPEK